MLHGLVKNGFDMPKTLKSMGIPYKQFWAWLEDDPTFNSRWLAVRESIVDLAEKVVVEKLKKGDSAIVKMVITTLGQNRGYRTTKEIITGKPDSGGMDRGKMIDALSKLTGEEIEQLALIAEKLGGGHKGSGNPSGGPGRKTA